MATKEVVILVGMQGSGKTEYCRTVLKDYARLSQDEGPRRFEPLLRAYLDMLAAGVERIVIDRTNPMAQQRRQFLEAARQRGYRTRIVYFDTPPDECRRRIAARAGHPTLDASQMEQAIASYLARLDKPTADECDELLVIQFP